MFWQRVKKVLWMPWWMFWSPKKGSFSPGSYILQTNEVEFPACPAHTTNNTICSGVCVSLDSTEPRLLWKSTSLSLILSVDMLRAQYLSSNFMGFSWVFAWIKIHVQTGGLKILLRSFSPEKSKDKLPLNSMMRAGCHDGCQYKSKGRTLQD